MTRRATWLTLAALCACEPTYVAPPNPPTPSASVVATPSATEATPTATVEAIPTATVETIPPAPSPSEPVPLEPPPPKPAPEPERASYGEACAKRLDCPSDALCLDGICEQMPE